VTALLGENDPRRVEADRQTRGYRRDQDEPVGHLPTPRRSRARSKNGDRGGLLEEEYLHSRPGLLDDPIFVKSTALINVRPLAPTTVGCRDLLKNYIMFSRTPSDYHADSCADLAKLWALPEVAGKTRLNILVVSHAPLPRDRRAPFQSGVHVAVPRAARRSRSGAVDSTGVRLLVAKRKEYFKEDRPSIRREVGLYGGHASPSRDRGSGEDRAREVGMEGGGAHLIGARRGSDRSSQNRGRSKWPKPFTMLPLGTNMPPFALTDAVSARP